MKIIECDKCGANSNQQGYWPFYTVTGICENKQDIDIRRDFCNPCYVELLKWINDERRQVKASS